MLFKTPAQRSRAFSTTASSLSNQSASSIASAFLNRFQSRGPQTRRQLLDANQLQLLSLTLNRPSLYPSPSPSLLSNNAPCPEVGTPIPPGHHLVYFTPAFLESELGADGTDTSYNPSAPFTRRMWAGGEVRWPRDKDGKLNLLRVGQTVSETTRVLSAEAKVVRRTGEEMVVVGVEKTFENEDGVAVIDRRNWVFRPALENSPATGATTQNTQSKPKPARETSSSTETKDNNDIHRIKFKRTPITLFRFSALTFNPHRIHYDQPWARDVEGHKNIVVHGPLNLISILDFWRDVKYQESTKDSELVVPPQSISYRATSPLYADEEYEIVLAGGKAEVFDQDGVLAMKAEITE